MIDLINDVGLIIFNADKAFSSRYYPTLTKEPVAQRYVLNMVQTIPGEVNENRLVNWDLVHKRVEENTAEVIGFVFKDTESIDCVIEALQTFKTKIKNKELEELQARLPMGDSNED